MALTVVLGACNGSDKSGNVQSPGTPATSTATTAAAPNGDSALIAGIRSHIEKQSFVDIEAKKAVNMIALNLLDGYDPNTETYDQKNSAFVDFTFSELQVFIDKYKNQKGADRLRIYFGKYGRDMTDVEGTPANEAEYGKMRTAVLVAAQGSRDFYDDAPNTNFKPVNIGTLCPPGSGCIESDNPGPVFLKEAKKLIKEGKEEYLKNNR